MMKKNHKEIFILLTFIIGFIIIRLINYQYHLNWSQDQADCGIEALRIFQTKKLTLIGPQISATLDGRMIFQGPITYYLFLFFLLLGQWNPITASIFFVIFSAIMIIPLFYGIKKLINEKAAWFIIIIYSFIPYYLNYTRFLWNSTLQMSFIPLLLFFMSLYKQKKTWPYFLLIAFWLGILLQFHYQFILVILGIFIYYFFTKKLKPILLVYFFGGIILGLTPLVLFELKHQFYNLQTILLFIKNWDQVGRAQAGTFLPHYYISISFMIIVFLMSLFNKKIKKISNILLITVTSFLIIYSLWLNIKIPLQSYWASATPWNYPTENKIYQIIQSTKIKTDFNVANLAYYDTKASVIKYFLKRDGYRINYDDYYQNKYLFVISEGDKYKDTLSYEVAFFKPNRILKTWKINEKFNMFLFERIK